MKSHELSYKHKKILQILYIVFLSVLSLSFFLMPFGMYSEEQTPLLLYLAGICFWVGLIGVVVTAVTVHIKRTGSARLLKGRAAVKQMGIFSFFQNPFATVADCVMFLSIGGFVIFKCFTDLYVATFILCALFVFSFGMHCFLNGINYKFLNSKDKGEKE